MKTLAVVKERGDRSQFSYSAGFGFEHFDLRVDEFEGVCNVGDHLLRVKDHAGCVILFSAVPVVRLRVIVDQAQRENVGAKRIVEFIDFIGQFIVEISISRYRGKDVSKHAADLLDLMQGIWDCGSQYLPRACFLEPANRYAAFFNFHRGNIELNLRRVGGYLLQRSRQMEAKTSSFALKVQPPLVLKQSNGDCGAYGGAEYALPLVKKVIPLKGAHKRHCQHDASAASQKQDCKGVKVGLAPACNHLGHILFLSSVVRLGEVKCNLQS